MTTAPDGRKIYTPRGQNPSEDLNLLADAIAASNADLFAKDGLVVWLNDAGKLVGVNADTLHEVIAKHVVTKGLVNKGTPDEPAWEVEFQPVQPDGMTLRALLKDDGSLLGRLPKLPGEPIKLTAQQKREICDRARMGEVKDMIARAYKIDIATVTSIIVEAQARHRRLKNQ